MRAGEGSSGRGIAGALVAEAGPVAVLRGARAAACDCLLQRARKRDLGGRKRSLAAGGDQGRGEARPFAPRGSDGDGELGHLGLDRVQPGTVGGGLPRGACSARASPFRRR